jgi:siderophore synthetase component
MVRDSLGDVPETANPDTSARAAVLARLWGALVREPIPGLTIGRLSGPAAAAQPFAVAPPDLAVELDGVPYLDPGDLARALGHPGLGAELDNSVANLALARSAQPVPDGGAPALARATRAPDPLVYMEQCVVDGHPLHPGCRTRMGLSPAEVRAYAPEHRGVVDLHLVRVPEQRWLGVNAAPVLVMHPWQREHVLDAYPWLSPTGETIRAHPLMSLRTLAVAGEPLRHYKTAVDVQMTSAVRTVSGAAVHNGPALSRMLAGVSAHAGVELLTEVAAGAVLVDGAPHRSLGYVERRMVALRPGEVALPLAALTAPSPATGRPIGLELIDDGYAGDALDWIEALARLLLPPLLRLLEIGVGLEAHGQNVLATVRGGRLARLLYRDLGGVRVSPRRLAAHGIEAPSLLGDLSTDDPVALRTKVFAAAVATVLSELVAVLGRELGTDAGKAWHRVAGVVRGIPGPDAAALFGAALPLKATTAMRLAASPVEDIWLDLPNPMAGLG